MHRCVVPGTLRCNYRALLAGVGDLERSIARLQSAGTGRDADHVILYEDAAKRRVAVLVSVLRGLQSLQVRQPRSLCPDYLKGLMWRRSEPSCQSHISFSRCLGRFTDLHALVLGHCA